MSWLGQEQVALATTRILDAAGELFARDGVRNVGMAEIAATAGCSRNTLYRYFGNRDDLRRAYVNREALRVAGVVGAAVRGIDDPAERIASAIVAALAEVRSTPALASWFTEDDQSITQGIAMSSDVIDAVALGILGRTGTPLEGRWLVRVIVSLLALPGVDAAEERAIIDRFVATPLARPTTR